LAGTAGLRVARRLLRSRHMRSRIEPWTIPLHVVMYTTFLVGFIMTLVVLFMR
jgi:hypothetical protein